MFVHNGLEGLTIVRVGKKGSREIVSNHKSHWDKHNEEWPSEVFARKRCLISGKTWPSRSDPFFPTVSKI